MYLQAFIGTYFFLVFAVFATAVAFRSFRAVIIAVGVSLAFYAWVEITESRLDFANAWKAATFLGALGALSVLMARLATAVRNRQKS